MYKAKSKALKLKKIQKGQLIEHAGRFCETIGNFLQLMYPPIQANVRNIPRRVKATGATYRIVII
ncbi:hypothetical protein HMPREF9445_01958 [Bacteroides clarus YIT 12056]|uniref:Uncharacterized protein n=1 Tax=Bacteroides clarus YIT 12056 TaxID=762984 RepID=A0ABN0CNA0_9BACE|nr:hypothetical protein HMPREF9445_01958 [Bacteroides clarus YIT 12056]